MPRTSLLLVAALLCASVNAQSVKVFWKCADKHLIALEHLATLNGKKIDLFLNYATTQQKGMHYSAIDEKSMANLPDAIDVGSYIMLGIKGQWFMNCVGQIAHKPHYKQHKLIFDVSTNAFGCPLIPKNCGVNNPDAAILEDN